MICHICNTTLNIKNVSALNETRLECPTRYDHAYISYRNNEVMYYDFLYNTLNMSYQVSCNVAAYSELTGRSLDSDTMHKTIVRIEQSILIIIENDKIQADKIVNRLLKLKAFI